jgi:hypothetical protein
MLELLLDQPGTPPAVSRRGWLRLSTLAGLGLAGSARGESSPSAGLRLPGFGRAKSVIVVFAGGGQSQIDTWDPKPLAPREIRGAFAPISTAVPGTMLCEHMPRLAKLADRYAIVRSMSHEDLDHGSACYLSLTGHYHKRRSSNPPPSGEDLPSYASIFKRLKPNAGFAEPAIQLNGELLVPKIVSPGQYAGLLGRDFEQMIVGDPLGETVVLPGLAPRPQLPQLRLEARRSLVEQLDEHSRRLEQDRRMRDLGILYERAFEMIARPETRNAFDLSAEPAELRRRYGMNRSGQACLLARRLAEAGVPLVTVMFNHTIRGQDDTPDDTETYGWDTHNDIFMALEDHLLPRFDLAFSALLTDLDERGMLDETLVICMGEFGRAPKVAFEKNFAGNSPGRKHWAAVYSIVAAGAGVVPGQFVGRSNAIGAYPASEQYSPGDLHATLFSALGIDPAGHFTDATGRPFPIATGKPIGRLYES